MTVAGDGRIDMDTRSYRADNEQVAARLRIVEEHVRCENEHDLPGIMATFADEAKYDDAPWADHRLGRDAVEEYYRDLLAAFLTCTSTSVTAS